MKNFLSRCDGKWRILFPVGDNGSKVLWGLIISVLCAICTQLIGCSVWVGWVVVASVWVIGVTAVDVIAAVVVGEDVIAPVHSNYYCIIDIKYLLNK